MKKYFYSHIIEIDSIHTALSELSISDTEKKHLFSLFETSLHYVILDAVLSELPEKDKKIFLKHVTSDNHDKVWEFLMGKVENIESKIHEIAIHLIDEMHRDIEETKNKNPERKK